jgi:phosphate-selective porin OprO/OprP
MRRSFQCYVGMVVLLSCLSWSRALAEGTSAASRAAAGCVVVAPVSTNTVQQAGTVRHLGDNLIWGWRWENGLEYELGSSGRVARAKERHPDSEVEPYHGKIGLKLHLDAAAYHADSDLGDMRDDSGVRRARLYTSGGFFFGVPISYKAEAEVADQNFYIREAYTWFWDLPVVRTMKVGHFKAPMTMEGYTSSGDTLFLERASPVEAFGPGIMYGIQAGGPNREKDRTWALGWFGDGGQSDISESSRSFTRAIGRVTWLPWCEEGQGAPKLFHLGASGQFLYSSENSVRYRSRPESYFAPRLVDTGDMDAQEATSAGLECALVNGPWCLQAELLDSIVSQESHTLDFWGGYVAGSWMMTGESHPYNRTLGCLTRPTPKTPFSLRKRHFGAWEVASRLSHLDLTDADVEGGVMSLATIGLNGYLTSRLKVAFDYAFGRVTDAAKDGDLRIMQGRVQYEF